MRGVQAARAEVERAEAEMKEAVAAELVAAALSGVFARWTPVLKQWQIDELR